MTKAMKIEIKKIDFSYDKQNQVIKELSLEIKENETVAIIGQNGSGKTTLVKQLNGILQPSKGDILFDGVSILGKSIAELSKKVGYVFQNPDDQLFLSTVQKELEFGPLQLGFDGKKQKECAQKAAEICYLTDVLEKHPLDLGASKKKFCTIASVISMDTEVVIFDEPTMGQDRKGIARLSEIVKYLKEQGKTCITISHDMKFVTNNFDRVIVLKNGELLLDGTPEEVFSKPEILSESYVTPPPITRVCQKCEIGHAVFRMEQFEETITKRKLT